MSDHMWESEHMPPARRLTEAEFDRVRSDPDLLDDDGKDVLYSHMASNEGGQMMATVVNFYEPGEVVWTMSNKGQPRAFKVQHDGSLAEMTPSEAFGE